jgi:hypothetical protein
MSQRKLAQILILLEEAASTGIPEVHSLRSTENSLP